jgi:hypothetical protein
MEENDAMVGDVMTDNEASTDNCSQRNLNFLRSTQLLKRKRR